MVGVSSPVEPSNTGFEAIRVCLQQSRYMSRWRRMGLKSRVYRGEKEYDFSIYPLVN